MKSKIQYVRFTEINDTEEEEWNFYIPVQGNEKALMLLQTSVMYSEDFWVGDTLLEEWQVDHLVKSGNTDGYFPEHSKMSGLLSPEEFVDAETGESLSAADVELVLYKGGIQDIMQET